MTIRCTAPLLWGDRGGTFGLGRRTAMCESPEHLTDGLNTGIFGVKEKMRIARFVLEGSESGGEVG